ncbi:MAG: hypothetical protein J1E40_06455 [Oscillospiraceae bacterium]|nr:hypothetical protein [Oscillospiraceae bacterium]
MSRTFTIDSNTDKTVTLGDLIDSIRSLEGFEKTGIDFTNVKMSRNYKNDKGENTYNDRSLIISRTDNGKFCMYINEPDSNNIFIGFTQSRWDDLPTPYYWMIESRALEGKSRSLFIAIACAIAILHDGKVYSFDGAWYGADIYTGQELWRIYLESGFTK